MPDYTNAAADKAAAAAAAVVGQGRHLFKNKFYHLDSFIAYHR